MKLLGALWGLHCFFLFSLGHLPFEAHSCVYGQKNLHVMMHQRVFDEGIREAVYMHVYLRCSIRFYVGVLLSMENPL